MIINPMKISFTGLYNFKCTAVIFDCTKITDNLLVIVKSRFSPK